MSKPKREEYASEYLEIAYAAVYNRLCFFTGTGFSKAVSGNDAPGWQELLEQCCLRMAGGQSLKAALFPGNRKNPLSLEEAAQVISIEMQNKNQSLHQIMAELIAEIGLKSCHDSTSSFFQSQTFQVVTTNYDKLAEALAETDYQSISPGLPIPRSTARVKIFHVHGSTDAPLNMVVTSDDYFRFMKASSYFSKKLSTLLHENTVVILGYSLSDTNLKAILNEYMDYSRHHVTCANIFFVSRDPVDQAVKDYYAHCYGIRVLDAVEIQDFFASLNQKIPEAEGDSETSIENMKKVIEGEQEFSKELLKMEETFYEIIFSISALGYSFDHPGVVKLLGDVIEAKLGWTKAKSAWEQYVQLARWLVYLAGRIELVGTSLQDIFLAATLKSMETMTSTRLKGRSWHAYHVWSNGWTSINSKNRGLIREYIQGQTDWEDALAVVRQI